MRHSTPRRALLLPLTPPPAQRRAPSIPPRSSPLVHLPPFRAPPQPQSRPHYFLPPSSPTHFPFAPLPLAAGSAQPSPATLSSPVRRAAFILFLSPATQQTRHGVRGKTRPLQRGRAAAGRGLSSRTPPPPLRDTRTPPPPSLRPRRIASAPSRREVTHRGATMRTKAGRRSTVSRQAALSQAAVLRRAARSTPPPAWRGGKLPVPREAPVR